MYISLSLSKVSSEWQCGHCLVGGHASLTLHCTNSGGEGSFRLTVPEDITNNDNDDNEVCANDDVNLVFIININIRMISE